MDSEQEFQLKLHEFVRHIELSLAKKRTAIGIFLDIVGAFDNTTYKGIADALQELEEWRCRLFSFAGLRTY